jgi:hypothetical protein
MYALLVLDEQAKTTIAISTWIGVAIFTSHMAASAMF